MQYKRNYVTFKSMPLIFVKNFTHTLIKSIKTKGIALNNLS